MKISVAWSNHDTPTASTVFGNIYYSRGSLLGLWHAEELPTWGIRRIWLEAPDLETGYDRAKILRDWVQNCGIAKADIMIGDEFLLDYVVGLERAAKRYKGVIARAIEQLKATRGWLKDHRIAEIRRDLEKALQ